VTAVPTSEPGSARAFPAGRLSDFEDAGDAGVQDPRYLSGLLPPRSARPRRAAVPDAEPVTPAPAVQPEPADEGTTQTEAAAADAPSTGQDLGAEAAGMQTADVQAAPAARPAPAGSDIDRLGGGIRTTRPPRRRTPRRGTSPEAPADAAGTPAAVTPAAGEAGTGEPGTEDSGAASNRLRASNVHIPASFMPRLAKARNDRKLSNGEWVIVALEATHDQLDSLIRPQPTGGSLFAPRATRAARVYDGPLTPYNIRLREADYAVIDELVEKFGASSRGHLITVAFDAFLPTT
jgi:hypothetical protein